MKGGVEAGDVARVGEELERGADPAQPVRLVQRRQRHQRLERLEKRGRDRFGRGEGAAAVHDAMRDGGDPQPRAARLDGLDCKADSSENVWVALVATPFLSRFLRIY